MKKFKIKLPGVKRLKKKNESFLTHFSFNTVTSMQSRKELRLVKYFNSIRERGAWLKSRDLSYSVGGSTGKTVIYRIIFAVLIILCLGGLYSVFQSGYVQHLLSESNYAKVEKVKIEGLHRLNLAEVYQASGIIRFQTSMLDVEADEVAGNIEKLAWVEDAQVNFDWPSTVEIMVREEVPIAMVHTPEERTQFHYLNKKGRIFTAVKDNKDIDYPVITGLSELKSDQYEHSLEQVLRFLEKIAKNNPVLPIHSISEIHVDRKGQLVVYLVDHTFPIYIGESDIDKAYKYLVRVLEDVYRKRSSGTPISEIGYIQLDYMEDRVLISEDNSG